MYEKDGAVLYMAGKDGTMKTDKCRHLWMTHHLKKEGIEKEQIQNYKYKKIRTLAMGEFRIFLLFRHSFSQSLTLCVSIFYHMTPKKSTPFGEKQRFYQKWKEQTYEKQ